MKSQKSTVVRGALALVATGAALGLTACSAGQVTQTAEQVSAVNGVNADEDNIALRDVAVIIGKDGDASLKFTAANEEDQGKSVKLNSIEVDGQSAQVSASKTIKAGCNLVIDSEENIDKIEKHASGEKCIETGTATISGAEDLYAGGHKAVTFKFNSGKIKLDAPVAAYTPEAGTLDRDDDGTPTEN